MTKRFLIIIMLGMTIPAHADISDSGNLTIGGQGVIVGTMTVQGNAFSVGGSTFSVLSGTVNVGGLLKVSATGIQWNDGTTSTSSSSGAGVGNVVLTATQTFTGANTFASTVTALGAANFWIMISSGDVTTSTFTPTIYFSGISMSSRTCAVEVISISTSSSYYPVFFFNGDPTAKYTYCGSLVATGGGYPGWCFANSIAAPIYMQHYSSSAQNISPNKRWRARIEFSPGEGGDNIDFVDDFLGDTAWQTGTKVRSTVSGNYSGGGPASSLSLGVSHNNAIDITGALTATDSFNGLHWEWWCKGFSYR